MNEQTLRKILDSPPRPVTDRLQSAAVALTKTYRSRWTFEFEGRQYQYFYHPYNLAWRNERAVEVPIAMGFLEAHDGESVLEIGNVLPHYFETDHDVVDKYEIAPGVTNVDAVEFDSGKKYDLIICISTLEHIGWDETPRDPARPQAALENLRRLLAPGGELVITVPVGLKPAVDRLLSGPDNPFGRTMALKRARWTNMWKQVPVAEAWGTPYSRLSFRAGAVIVGSLEQ